MKTQLTSPTDITSEDLLVQFITDRNWGWLIASEPFATAYNNAVKALAGQDRHHAAVEVQYLIEALYKAQPDQKAADEAARNQSQTSEFLYRRAQLLSMGIDTGPKLSHFVTVHGWGVLTAGNPECLQLFQKAVKALNGDIAGAGETSGSIIRDLIVKLNAIKPAIAPDIGLDAFGEYSSISLAMSQDEAAAERNGGNNSKGLPLYVSTDTLLHPHKTGFIPLKMELTGRTRLSDVNPFEHGPHTNSRSQMYASHLPAGEPVGPASKARWSDEHLTEHLKAVKHPDNTHTQLPPDKPVTTEVFVSVMRLQLIALLIEKHGWTAARSQNYLIKSVGKVDTFLERIINTKLDEVGPQGIAVTEVIGHDPAGVVRNGFITRSGSDVEPRYVIKYVANDNKEPVSEGIMLSLKHAPK